MKTGRYAVAPDQRVVCTFFTVYDDEEDAKMDFDVSVKSEGPVDSKGIH